MIQPLRIQADLTASVGRHEIRIHGEDDRFTVDASSWAPLLRLRRAASNLGARVPDPPRRQSGFIAVRVRETTVFTLRLEGGRTRRRIHPIGIVRSLFA